MKQGQYIELVGPAGSGKSTFYERISQKHSDILNMKRAAWEMLRKTDVLPVHLRYLPKLLSAKLAGRSGQRKYAKIWLEENCSAEDRELLRTANVALKEVITTDIRMEWLRNRQPVVLARGLLAQKFRTEQQKTVIGDESVLQNIASVFWARKTKRDISSEMRRFIELVPKPDVVVSFRAPPEILWERIHNRSKAMPDIFPDYTFDQFRTDAELANVNIQSMRSAFEQSGVTWCELTPEDDAAKLDDIIS